MHKLLFNIIPFQQKVNKSKLLLTAISLCMSVVFLDQSSISVILTAVQRDLRITDLTMMWVVNSYLLSLSLLLIIGGKLSDIFGARRVFITGAIIFFVSSLICAISMKGWVLIAGRALQGIGASLLIPSNLTFISKYFPEAEQGKIMGTAVNIGAIFFAIGPFIAGVLTQYLSWRDIFIINLPVSCIMIILINLTTKNEDVAFSLKNINLNGLLFIISFAALIMALMLVPDRGIVSREIISLFLIFLVSIMFFVYFEINSDNQFLQLSKFIKRDFLIGNSILFCIQVCVVSVIFWSLWLQQCLNFTPLLAGLAILPGFIPAAVLSRLSGKWLDRVGPRQPICVGTFLITIGLLWIAMFACTRNYSWIFVGMLSYGLGAAISIPNIATLILSSVHQEYKGIAAGILNTTRQIGGCFGFALISSITAGIQILSYSNRGKILTNTFDLGMWLTFLFSITAFLLAYRLVNNK